MGVYVKIIEEKALQTQGWAQELQGQAPAMPRTTEPQRPGPPAAEGRRPAAGVRQLATARRLQKASPPAADRIKGRAALPGAAVRTLSTGRSAPQKLCCEGRRTREGLQCRVAFRVAFRVAARVAFRDAVRAGHCPRASLRRRTTESQLE